MKRTPLKRGKRVNPINSRRRKKRNQSQFGPKAEWIRTLPCRACARSAPSDPAHVRSRGSLGEESVHWLVPLCRLCHQAQHSEGVITFGLRRGLDLRALAEEYEKLWQAQKSA